MELPSVDFGKFLVRVKEDAAKLHIRHFSEEQMRSYLDDSEPVLAELFEKYDCLSTILFELNTFMRFELNGTDQGGEFEAVWNEIEFGGGNYFGAEEVDWRLRLCELRTRMLFLAGTYFNGDSEAAEKYFARCLRIVTAWEFSAKGISVKKLLLTLSYEDRKLALKPPSPSGSADDVLDYVLAAISTETEELGTTPVMADRIAGVQLQQTGKKFLTPLLEREDTSTLAFKKDFPDPAALLEPLFKISVIREILSN